MLGYVLFAATRRIAPAEINTDSAKQCERVSVSGPGWGGTAGELGDPATGPKSIYPPPGDYSPAHSDRPAVRCSFYLR